MQIGDVIENAIWLTGDETPAMKDKYQADVLATIDDLCSQEGFTHGPITCHELRPGEDRTPPVPDHIEGPGVRLLVVESTLFEQVVVQQESSFVDSLELDDLTRLRKITKGAVAKHFKRCILDTECDEIIESLGPDAAANALSRSIN